MQKQQNFSKEGKMKKITPTINEIVEYGLDTIDPDKTINVNLKDLLYIYKSIEEFNRFFHQPMHYEKVEDIKIYMGDKNEGAFSIIGNIYYKIFDRIIPESVKEIVESDDFQHPDYPFYYYD